MYRRKDRKTLTLFKEMLPFGGQLDLDNRWLKLKKLIPWEDLEDEYAKYFSDIGRPALDGRLVTGALCIKHKKKISDEELMDDIQENPYAGILRAGEFCDKRPVSQEQFEQIKEAPGRRIFQETGKRG